MMHRVAARSKSEAAHMLIITVFGYVLSRVPAAAMQIQNNRETTFDTLLKTALLCSHDMTQFKIWN